MRDDDRYALNERLSRLEAYAHSALARGDRYAAERYIARYEELALLASPPRSECSP